MRIGIDVGGTNTDAVLMDGRSVLAEVKAPTTLDVTNAVVEAKRLMPTACIRLGLPATQALPPMVDWPDRLRQALGNHYWLCHGGHEFDGREISPLDPDE